MIEAKHGKVRIGTKSYVVKISDPELLSKLEDEIDPYRAGMILARKLNTPAIQITVYGFGESAQMVEVCRIADKLREELIEIEQSFPEGESDGTEN